jgi:DNA-binding transcriptional MerR regulator
LAKKLFYRIGEACKQLDIQPYVLRYWETEFPVLSPKKSKAGQRVYSEEELRLILRIKQLLYEEGYTIAGAKKKLDSELGGNGLSRLAEPPGDPHPQRAKATPATSVAPAAAGTQSVSSPLDRPDAQQVESLRSELRGALAEARAILRLLSD